MTADIMGTDLNIIIDTDPGTDDALALGAAAVFFKDNIRALVSTYGNVDGEQAYTNLLNLAGILNIAGDFLKGSLYPLGKYSFTPTDYHGKNGLCGLILPTARRERPAKDFLQNLYNIIKQYKNIKYIAIGPLTNLARLFDRFPDAADYIGELIIMGGGFEAANMPHNTEYNFNTDAAAVEKVLSSSGMKVIAPLDMTHKLAFSLEEIEYITSIKHELLTDDMTDAFNALSSLFYLNYDAALKHGESGAIIHDATTLAYLYDNSKCDLREYQIRTDEYGAVSKDEHSIRVFVIEKIDRDYIKNLLKETFNLLKKGVAV